MLLSVAAAAVVALPATYPWPNSGGEPLAARIAPPPGYTRVPVGHDSFGAWLRNLPTKPGRPPVLLYNGQRKSNQQAHYLVLDVDVGTGDLQQCADAVIRLRAEWLRQKGDAAAICFRFTSGDAARWTAYRDGQRPQVHGSKVSWVRRVPPRDDDTTFRAYLDMVFTYAGSLSLAKELSAVASARHIAPGDVFIQGGSPGHAMLVVDVAENAAKERVFLLAQSYMPAQEIHVVRCFGCRNSPWYPADGLEAVDTPEWRFGWGDLKRFGAAGCR